MTDRRPDPPRRPRLSPRRLRGLARLFLIPGTITLLVVGYQVYVTDWFADARQSELKHELEAEWSAAPTGDPTDDPTVDVPALPEGKISEVPLGEGFAIIRIPRFGGDWAKVVLEGTDEDKLVDGPGHYVDTAMPGETGNFALAGHRVGKGSPFLHLDKLESGDAVVIETAASWYVYRVVGTDDPNGVPAQHIVAPSEVDTIAPVPNAPDAEPNRAYITLTTCHPKFSDEKRLVVHGALDGPPLSKTDYPTPADVPALAEA